MSVCKVLVERTVVALYQGEPMDWRLACTKGQLKSLSEALVATRQFEKRLLDESASLEEVADGLRVKHAYAREFERQFGQPWPL